MDQQIHMPKQIMAQWAGKRQSVPEDGMWYLARHTFTVETPAPFCEFWISTGGAYQLILNSRVVGCGPRPHHLPDTSYVDQYDLSKFLVEGENVVALLFRGGPVGAPRHPGFWCQLEIDGTPVLWSDQNWAILETDRGIMAPVRQDGCESVSMTMDREVIPMEWFRPDMEPGKRWCRPDWLRTIAMPGGYIAFHPLLPPEISEDPFPFEPAGGGRARETGTATGFNLFDCYSVPGVYAGATFRFAETAETISAFFTSDVPFRLFCNNRLVAARSSADALEIELPLHAGWNRLLVYQEACRQSAGTFFCFPGESVLSHLWLTDTVETAPPGWNLVGPLRLELKRANAGIRLEGLPMRQYRKRADDTYLNAAWLRHLELRDSSRQEEVVANDHFRRFKIDRLRYGVLAIEFDAPSGGIVDIAVGSSLDAGGRPIGRHGARTVYTIRTSEGINRFISVVPEEMFHLAILARRTDTPIVIRQLYFYELCRIQNRETAFRCSDATLNAIWDVGLATLRRAAAFQEPVWDEQGGARMIDQCVQSYNMVAIFNDYQYSRGRLACLLESQLESGEFPVETHGRSMPFQLEHLFALPLWLLYHHRSGNDPELLTGCIPAVDRLIGYFDGLVDEELGLIQSPSENNGLLRDIYDQNEFLPDTVPVSFNNSYCRMLLSAGDIYTSLGMEKHAARCFRSAVLIAERIKKLALDSQTGLLPRNLIAGVPEYPDDLYSNFTALLAGVHAPSDFERIFYEFFNFNPPFTQFPEEMLNGYFNFFFLEMLFSLNQSEWGLRFLREYYGNRIDPESRAWKRAPQGAEIVAGGMSEGGSIVPNAFILREAAGIRAAEPGFSSVYFHPPLGVLDYAEITLPTVYGEIRLWWQKQKDGSLAVRIDANYELRVIPELPDDMIDRTSFEIGSSVTIIPPPEPETA